MNCIDPNDDDTRRLCKDLSSKYNTPVLPINCLELDEVQIKQILLNILYEFPVACIGVDLPCWFKSLDANDKIRKSVVDCVKSNCNNVSCVRSVYDFAKAISKSATFTKRGYGVNFNLTTADADISIRLFDEDCLWGDANHDGKVNSHDASLVLCYIIGKPTEETFCTKRTDVNQDGKINSHDASIILQYIIGKVDSLPHND